MAAIRRNLFLKSSFKKRVNIIFHLDIHKTAPDGRQSDENFRNNQLKSPNSSRKLIKKNFWKSQNQYFILTSFIESKKQTFAQLIFVQLIAVILFEKT
jgi:hypothetical protein